MSSRRKTNTDIDINNIKVPPHSLEAEQCVLGALMLDNQAWDRISGHLNLLDFYEKKHQIIFKTIEDIVHKGHPIDVLVVSETLKNTGHLEAIDGDAYLFQLAHNTPSAANIIAYANIVRERSILRQLIGISNEIANDAFYPEGRSSHQILDEAESRIFAIAEQKQQISGPQNINTLLTKTVERIDALFHNKQAITGLPTGYQNLDELTLGLQDSDFIVVAARPSMGKTSFALNIAEHAAIKSKQPVLIFSLEMPAEALVMRLLSSLGRIDQHKLRTGKLDNEDWPRITSAISMLSTVPLFIDDSPGLTPSDLRARARRLAREKGKLGLIIVDYLQLLQIPENKENRTTEISLISQSLKVLAKELKVPVIALSQLNRSLEQRTNKRPLMSDLRESGAIEQDADLILFIYRDEVYDKESRDKGTAEIIIAKQRNGPIGDVRLTFLGKYTRFENYSPDRME